MPGKNKKVESKDNHTHSSESTISETLKADIGEEQRQQILKEIVRQSIEHFRNSEAARKYFEALGFDPLRLLQSHTFGFWSNDLYSELADGEGKKLELLGLKVGEKFLFENSILYPLYKGREIATIGGQRIDGINTYTYLQNLRQGLFLPNNGLDSQRPVILVQSIVEALSLFSAGITNVLPLMGLNGFFPDHLDHLRKQNFPKIFICFESNEAGNKTGAMLNGKLTKDGFETEIIQLPDGKSINAMLNEIGDNKLRQWFKERITSIDENPTVWEDGEDLYVLLDNREYRIRGLATVGMDRMRVNVKGYSIENKNRFYMDTLDLLTSRGRENYSLQLSRTLDVERRTIVHDLNRTITVLEEVRLNRKFAETQEKVETAYQMSEEEKREAMEYLQKPDLIERIWQDFETCVMVGNKAQCMLAYLGCSSRFVENPLGILFVSRSAVGKSYTQQMVSSFIPAEQLLPMTRLTGQALFYRDEEGLRHKVISIEELMGMEEALYSVRTLLSNQRLELHGLTIDSKTKELKPFEKVVYGPASVMVSTTELSRMDNETKSRFYVLHLDESTEQTRNIIAFQGRMASDEGIGIRLERERIRKLHQNIQRLIKTVFVVNNKGTGITYPMEMVGSRREGRKIQSLIETIALLHQFQRPLKEKVIFGIKTQYIEVEQSDIDIAVSLAKESLQQSFDELTPSGRQLLADIFNFVLLKFAKESETDPDLRHWQIPFTRVELQKVKNYSRYHLREYLAELVDAGYIVRRPGLRGERYAYALVADELPALPQIA